MTKWRNRINYEWDEPRITPGTPPAAEPEIDTNPPWVRRQAFQHNRPTTPEWKRAMKERQEAMRQVHNRKRLLTKAKRRLQAAMDELRRMVNAGQKFRPDANQPTDTTSTQGD